VNPNVYAMKGKVNQIHVFFLALVDALLETKIQMKQYMEDQKKKMKF
jgi:hypothetical protein